MHLHKYRDESRARHFDLISAGKSPRSIDLVAAITSGILVIGFACALMVFRRIDGAQFERVGFAKKTALVRPAAGRVKKSTVACARHRWPDVRQRLHGLPGFHAGVFVWDADPQCQNRPEARYAWETGPCDLPIAAKGRKRG
jgi:hypothetical protein